MLSFVGGSLQAGFLFSSFVMPGADQSKPVFHPPEFCRDLDCPRYTVLETNDKFEKRRYEPSVWVATKTIRMLYTEQDRTTMFFKLFHYISGNNSAHSKIDMTTPVVTEVIHGQGPDCESNFTMHFLIPYALQANPPQPTEKDVFIRHVPEMTVFVKQYGGFDTDQTKLKNLQGLIDDLNAASKSYRDDLFYTAGYDGPYALKRHNEIWTVAM